MKIKSFSNVESEKMVPVHSAYSRKKTLRKTLNCQLVIGGLMCLFSVMSLLVLILSTVNRVNNLENDILQMKTLLERFKDYDKKCVCSEDNSPTTSESYYDILGSGATTGIPSPDALEDFSRKRRNVISEAERSSDFKPNTERTVWPFQPILHVDTTDTDQKPTTSSSPKDVSHIRVTRRSRDADLEDPLQLCKGIGRMKRLPTVHYSGDTSKYILGRHSNFNGNGHLKHPQRTFVDWKTSEWIESAGMDAYFSIEEGIVSIKETGLYFIYAQIYYLDEHDMMGYQVFRNRDVILQCTITQHSSIRRLKGNTCYTAGVEYLAEDDEISLADVTEGKYSLFEPGKSFFGLIKLGDMKLK